MKLIKLLFKSFFIGLGFLIYLAAIVSFCVGLLFLVAFGISEAQGTSPRIIGLILMAVVLITFIGFMFLKAEDN